MQNTITLVMRSASLIDEWLHTHSLSEYPRMLLLPSQILTVTPEKPFKATTLTTRIKDCIDKLGALRNLMMLYSGAQHIADAILSGGKSSVADPLYILLTTPQSVRH